MRANAHTGLAPAGWSCKSAGKNSNINGGTTATTFGQTLFQYNISKSQDNIWHTTFDNKNTKRQPKEHQYIKTIQQNNGNYYFAAEFIISFHQEFAEHFTKFAISS